MCGHIFAFGHKDSHEYSAVLVLTTCFISCVRLYKHVCTVRRISVTCDMRRFSQILNTIFKWTLVFQPDFHSRNKKHFGPSLAAWFYSDMHLEKWSVKIFIQDKLETLRRKRRLDHQYTRLYQPGTAWPFPWLAGKKILAANFCTFLDYSIIYHCWCWSKNC